MQLLSLGTRQGRFHETLVSSAALATTPTAQAVLLDPAEDVEVLRSFLNRLDLVVLQFPTFRDGRAFTQARALREYYGYTGEIRAEGQIIPDQATFLRRCGVDTVVLPRTHADPSVWHTQLGRFGHYYQKA